MKTQALPDTEPHSVHPTRDRNPGAKPPEKTCLACHTRWARDLLKLLKDPTLHRIAVEIIEGLKPETIRKHCNMRMKEWRASLERIKVAIKALWDNDGDDVLFMRL